MADEAEKVGTREMPDPGGPPEVSVHLELIDQLESGSSRHSSNGSRVIQKIAYDDASYAKPGPYPFVCGQCKHLTWGPSRDPEQAVKDPDDSLDLCQIVEGPYDDGGVSPADSCRFWASKPATHRDVMPDREED